MKIKKHFDEHPRVQFNTIGESLTHQAPKDECDINNIMAKWERTGVLDHFNKHQGQYGDFTEIPTNYQESLNSVLLAEEMFNELPSKIRRKFANDPGNFLDFATDPENIDEMIKLGLAQRHNEVIENDPLISPENTPPGNPKASNTPSDDQPEG